MKKNNIGKIAFSAFVFIWLAQLKAWSAQDPVIKHVFLVSIDGLKPESYTQADHYGLKIPNLRQMMKDGAFSPGARSVMPANTYPSHTSIITGVNPARHGIVTNVSFDPPRLNGGGWRWYSGDIHVPTIWGLAYQQGLKTGMIDWPVTVGAKADFVLPEFWRSCGEENFTADDLKLLSALSTPGLWDEVSGEFPNFRQKYSGDFTDRDEAATEAAVHLIAKYQPSLILLHLAQVDHLEHLFGPFSPEAKQATENADALLGQIEEAAKKTGIWKESVLFVVSDHGFMPTRSEVDPGILLFQNGLIALSHHKILDWQASILSNGGSAYIYLENPKDKSLQKKVRNIFIAAIKKPASGIRRVISESEIRRLGGDPKAFLALEAKDGIIFGSHYSGDYTRASWLLGNHGYFPDNLKMRASLLVYGPAIKKSQIKSARLIDVAPTIASWLKLPLKNTDGKNLPVRLK